MRRLPFRYEMRFVGFLLTYHDELIDGRSVCERSEAATAFRAVDRLPTTGYPAVTS
jgi:hypothetical protein